MLTASYGNPRQVFVSAGVRFEPAEAALSMKGFAEREWTSRDGLRHYARDYAGASGEARLPVVCLHGLTRNSKDFEYRAHRGGDRPPSPGSGRAGTGPLGARPAAQALPSESVRARRLGAA